jgi:hypothetical protein
MSKFLSRKFLLAVLTPVFVTIFNIINGFMPEGARLSPDQVSSAINWIVGAIIAAIFSQGAVDTMVEAKKPTPAGFTSTAPVPSDYTGVN